MGRRRATAKKIVTSSGRSRMLNSPMRRNTWRKMASRGTPSETGQLNRCTSISSRDVRLTLAFIAAASPDSVWALPPARLCRSGWVAMYRRAWSSWAQRLSALESAWAWASRPHLLRRREPFPFRRPSCRLAGLASMFQVDLLKAAQDGRAWWSSPELRRSLLKPASPLRRLRRFHFSAWWWLPESDLQLRRRAWASDLDSSQRRVSWERWDRLWECWAAVAKGYRLRAANLFPKRRPEFLRPFW